jgi:hypothetical protein
MTEYGGLFEAELRAFAHLEAAIKESIAEQEDQIDRLHALYEAAIAPLVEAINAQQAILDQQREALTEQIRQHIIQNGSEGLHHDIHHSRRSEPKFDKDAALAEAIRRNATDYIRVKHELDLVPLKKALRNGEISWIAVEWEDTIHISFNKLGDLVITTSSG